MWLLCILALIGEQFEYHSEMVRALSKRILLTLCSMALCFHLARGNLSLVSGTGPRRTRCLSESPNKNFIAS